MVKLKKNLRRQIIKRGTTDPDWDVRILAIQLAQLVFEIEITHLATTNSSCVFFEAFADEALLECVRTYSNLKLENNSHDDH